MATGGRKTQLPLIHEISARIVPGKTSGVLGTLPAGAIVNMTHLVVSQVWDGTTNQISVGMNPVNGGEYMSLTDLKTLVRSDVLTAAGLAGPFPYDVIAYWWMSQTGPAPTQGVATLWIDYLPGAG